MLGILIKTAHGYSSEYQNVKNRTQDLHSMKPISYALTYFAVSGISTLLDVISYD